MSQGMKVVKLNDPILHYPYQNEEQLRDKAVRYAQLYAQENFRKKHASPSKAQWKSVVTFIKDYILRKGWMYGSDGFTIARYNALGAKLKYNYLYEENKRLGISLIISTYNRPDALARVLESVCTQSRKPDQVIIADDGSTAYTAEVINAFKSKIPSLHHVWHEDTGFRLAAIRNLALRHVNHDFVSMIDGDMVLHPDFIQNIDNHVQKGWYYQGKRVLLDSTNTNRVLINPNYQIGFLTSGIQNRFNTLNFPLLSRWLSRTENTIRGVKGCSMHFWLEDAVRINGFNESFIGWGREDSEFVCRLLNAGVKRKNIALGAVAWHLYHPEASRKMLPENDAILEKCISEKHSFTHTGLNPASGIGVPTPLRRHRDRHPASENL
jgi:GT2 family glycosyltransferase